MITVSAERDLGCAAAQPQRLSKRAIDVAIALPLFVLFLPAMLLIAVGLWLRSPGPVLYAHEREGWDGQLFPMWKFRTMFTDADRRLECHLAADPLARFEWSKYCKLRHDPRIVPGIGLFLRRSSLDELPQLWNVLRGDMTLVGPRPFPLYHLAGFSNDFRMLRRSVVPGLTGLWQIGERSEADLCRQEELDRAYISNMSLKLDLWILISTIHAVAVGRGAR